MYSENSRKQIVKNLEIIHNLELKNLELKTLRLNEQLPIYSVNFEEYFKSYSNNYCHQICEKFLDFGKIISELMRIYLSTNKNIRYNIRSCDSLVNVTITKFERKYPNLAADELALLTLIKDHVNNEHRELTKKNNVDIQTNIYKQYTELKKFIKNADVWSV